MKSSIAILIVFASCCLFFCNRQVTENLKVHEAEIRAVLDAQMQGWNRGDIEEYMQGYWQSDSLRFASGGTINFGWQKVLERYRQRYSNRELMGKLTFSEVDVKMLSPQAALVFGKWELERANDQPWGLYTLIMRRTNDGWRVVHDHTSAAEQ